LLNIGVPIAASAGTDSFAGYYRSMAVGATRVFVRVDGSFNMENFVDSLKAGKSFLSTGPLLRFEVDGAQPGEVVTGENIAWKLMVASPEAVEKVEILLNGVVVWSGEGLPEFGRREYHGSMTVPAGGWIAARAHGGEEVWPGMSTFPFAHTSPIWINERGSTDPEAARQAARDLLRVLDVAEDRLLAGYGDVPIPKLVARIAETRERLRSILGGQ
jgi:TolB protein